MKKVISSDVDQTLNVAKTPITPAIATLLTRCLDYFEFCPISGQKFDQFIIQIVNPLLEAGATPEQLKHLHLFVAQGTQYYHFDGHDWQEVYSYPLTDDQIGRISEALEISAKELNLWPEDEDDEIIENRLSQVTFSGLGQHAGTEEKYAWDPDHSKRERIVERAKELAPDFEYQIAGTTSINAFVPGMDKEFGMNKLMEYLKVNKSDILYFGDMTQPGGNDYPVKHMGIDTITVRSHEDTAFALRGLLGILD